MEKKKKLIAIIAIVFMIVLFGAMSYAFFTTGADNSNMTKANLTTGTMALTFADNDNGINERLLIGESVTKKFTIQNTGTLDSSLSMDWDSLVNTYTNGSLSYKLEYSDTEEGEYQTLVDTSNIPVSRDELTQTMAGEISVPAGSTYYYNLVITFENLADVDQTKDAQAIFHTKFSVGQPVKYRYYTLVIDTAGGTAGDITGVQEYQLQNLDTLNLPTPTRVGYTFKGWKLQGVSSNVNDETFTMGLANTTLTAEWEAKSYTVSIDAAGGEYTGETSITLDYDSSIELSTPTREGYTFNGWMVSGGTLEVNTFTLTDASNVSITASWSVNSYNYVVIHRQMNISGSGYTEIERESGSLDYGKTLSPVPKTYTGFTSPSKETITIGVDESSNVITYDYDRNQYTVTINADGGEYSGDTSIKMYYGASTTLATPTREGYTFTGWSTNYGKIPNNTFTLSDANNVSITANWSINSYGYTIIHRQMKVSGSGYTEVDRETGTLNYGETLSPTPKTYTGFTSPSKKTITIGVDESSNVITYDYDRNQYTLTIDVDGGTYSGDTSVKMYYGASTTISTPTKTGHTFAGWNVSAGELNTTTFTMGASNAKLTATWETNDYKYIVYHNQMNTDGSGYTLVSADTNEGTAKYGTTVTPNVNTYTGFTSPSKKSLTIKVDTNTPPTLNVVNYNYTRNQYTLTIKPNGGTYGGVTTDTTKTMYYNSSITLSTPTRTGYTFTGWTKSAGTLSGSTFTIASGNASVTAGWSVNSYAYTVNHYQMNTDGSTYTLKDTESLSANYGTSVTPSVKTYTGFKAPSTSSLTIGVDTSKNVVNYYYSRNQYTLTIKPNGGTYKSSTSDTTVKMYYGTSTTISTPTRTGYTFNGWTKSAGTLSGSTFSIGTSDATLTAGWTVNSYAYTVNHYQMNVSGSGYTLKETQNLSANYGTTQTPAVKSYTGFTAPSTKSITIVVDTTKNVVDYYYTRNQYTLTVNANGGSTTVTSGKRYYGAQVSLSATRTGYNLSSWTRTSGTTGTISGSTFTMGAGDATVQANWTAKTFTVTFNANGGTTPTASKTVTYASTYGTLPTPTYTGYNFLGWYTAASGGTQVTSSTKVSITANQTLYAHWELAAGVETTIATLNITPKSGTPTFTKTATTDEGVYSLEDNYGTSYYYRGAVTNNYVKFAGFYWRIIRVNGDGSIRMIYDGTQAYTNGTSATARSALTDVAWNVTYADDAKYVGYMYGRVNGVASTSKVEAQTNETSTNVKRLLEAWYKTNIETPGYEKYLADVIFCNDRSTDNDSNTSLKVGYGTNKTYYGAYNRLVINKSTSTPTFICPTNSTVSSNNDWFTADATTANKGNGALDQPVGLITADEIVAAGGVYEKTNQNYYLYKGHWYWSLSPGISSSRANVFRVYSTGYLYNYSVDNAGAVAPVINLSAEYAVKLTGTGISTDPFTLS